MGYRRDRTAEEEKEEEEERRIHIKYSVARDCRSKLFRNSKASVPGQLINPLSDYIHAHILYISCTML